MSSSLSHDAFIRRSSSPQTVLSFSRALFSPPQSRIFSTFVYLARKTIGKTSERGSDRLSALSHCRVFSGSLLPSRSCSFHECVQGRVLDLLIYIHSREQKQRKPAGKCKSVRNKHAGGKTRKVFRRKKSSSLSLSLDLVSR